MVVCAVGVAEEVAVSGTALAVLGILDTLTLDGYGGFAPDGARDQLGLVAAVIGDAGVLLRTVLSGQTAADVGGEVAGGIDPAEVDVGVGQAGECAKNERGSHGGRGSILVLMSLSIAQVGTICSVY